MQFIKFINYSNSYTTEFKIQWYSRIVLTRTDIYWTLTTSLYLLLTSSVPYCTPITPLKISSNQHCIPLYIPTVLQIIPLQITVQGADKHCTLNVHHCTVLLTSTVSHWMALYRALTSTTVHGTEQHCNSLYPSVP